MKEIIITKTAKETEKIANRFSRRILKSSVFAQATAGKKQAVIVGLTGDLGSGKTVFAKGFAKGFGIKEIVVSPTFVLERIYRLKSKSFKLFIHIDAYRIRKAKELVDLGFKDLAADSRNIILIEWADRVKKILPKNHIEIKFEHISNSKRKITIRHLSDRAQ